MTASLFLRGLVMVAVLSLLAACATGPRITVEADPQADFSRYRTFAFYSPLALEARGYATPTSERVKAAARAQLEARGYRYQERDPDLLVNLNGYLQERTDVHVMPEVDYAYYYSYRARAYVASPYWRDRTSVHRYTEGTLNVDIVDRARNQLVWEGVAVGRVGRMPAEERLARIDGVVADIMARYPARAGAP